MRAARAAPIAAAVCLSMILAGCRAERGLSAVTAGSAEQPAGVGCLGRITPGERLIKVSAPPGSIVKALRVRRGSKLTRGEEVAVLRDYDASLAALHEAESQVVVETSTLAQARAGEKPAAVAAQQAAVSGQELVVENTEKDLQRKNEMFHEGLLAQMDLDAAKLAADSAKESLRRERQLLESLTQVRQVDVAVAERKLALAQVQEDRARVELERNRITAPISGTVLEIYAYPGEAVSDQGICDLGDTDNMFVNAEVYVSDIPRVHEGSRAVVTGDGFAGQLAGKVAEILRETSDSQLYPTSPLTAADKRVLTVRIRLEDPSKVRGLNNNQVFVRIEP